MAELVVITPANAISFEIKNFKQMKRSRKIVLMIGGIVIVLLSSGLMVMRTDLLFALRKSESESNFKTVVVENFKALDFSADWIVNIRQGSEYKVELAFDKETLRTPKMENVNGTLYFTVDSLQSNDKSKSIYAKITAPALHHIKGVKGTTIHLRDFESDSISLVLENGCVFTGNNNHFKNISFKTSGDVSVQLTEIEEGWQ